MTEKEDLEYLLKLLAEIKKEGGNEWFWDKLNNSYLAETAHNKDFYIGIAKNVESIKKYLLIDVIPLIDYSDIEDKVVREQLERDCVEMGKYRLGKINDRIKFDEFCRYAHLQAEELINYFFSKKYGRIEKIVTAIQANNEHYKPVTIPFTLNSIQYFTKLVAYKSISNIEFSTYSILLFLNEFRNEMSHRNSMSLKNEEKILIQFKERGFKENQFIDYNMTPKGDLRIFNEGKFVITKRKEDYNTIYEELEALKMSIIRGIKSTTPIKRRDQETAFTNSAALIKLKQELDKDKK